MIAGKRIADPRLLPTGSQDADDFSEVSGQETVKRTLVIAAGGGHNVLA